MSNGVFWMNDIVIDAGSIIHLSQLKLFQLYSRQYFSKNIQQIKIVSNALEKTSRKKGRRK